MLKLENVDYRYKTLRGETQALSHINLSIEQGEFLVILGPSGSGKSTLLLHLNGILRPTAGRVLYQGQDINVKGYNLMGLRRDIAVMFQFPEDSFFGETVYEDVAYGPYNHGLRGEALRRSVEKALSQAGVDPSIGNRSPFSLAGGEKRKVSLAGLLAMDPRILVLDEPTAGLDPLARKNLLGELDRLNKQGKTIIMVSHDIEELVAAAKRIVILAEGTIKADGPARVILARENLEQWGLKVPDAVQLGKRLNLNYQGHPVVTVEEVVQAILARRDGSA